MPIYFGDKIREARKAAGLTQRQLAEKIKVSNGSICNWEKNLSRPDPDTIQNLCWALGVQPNFFFGESAPIVSKPIELNSDESDLIRKYRALDNAGRGRIKNALDYEYNSLPGSTSNIASKEA